MIRQYLKKKEGNEVGPRNMSSFGFMDMGKDYIPERINNTKIKKMMVMIMVMIM